MTLTDLILRKACGLSNRAVLQFARWRYPRPPDWCRRIAFSEQEAWEPVLRRAFTGWPVDLVFARFADLTLEDFDLVVPLNVGDALWLTAQADFNSRNAIPVAPADVIETCDDKKAFEDAITAAGLGIHVPSRAERTTYPYVLKKRRDHSSISTRIIRDEADEERLGPLARDPEYFTQDLIRGRREYATHINFMAGEVVSELTVEFTFSIDHGIKLKDPVLFQRYVRCPDLLPMEAMLRALRYEGLCCFNYKLSNGRIVVFELNPRFGGTLCPYFFAFVGALGARRK